MDLRQLRYFVQIAECGGFTRASEILHVAQSALSRQMGHLEAELGVALFERTARGVRLTPAGELMVDRATGLLRQFQEIKSELLALAETPHGKVSFGIPAIMRETLAIPLVQKFNELYPEVEITFVTGLSQELREWLIAGKIDLAVYGLLEPESVLATQTLTFDDIVLVGRPPLPLPAGASVAIDDIAEFPLAVSTREQLRQLLRRTGSRTAFNFARIPEISDSALLLEMLLTGRYYSILPRGMVSKHVEAGDLEVRPIPDIRYEWVVAHSRDHAPSAAERTIEQMLHEIVSTTGDAA